MNAEPLPTRTPAVAIIGGGPAGLTAAAHLKGRVAGEVLVLDLNRDSVAAAHGREFLIRSRSARALTADGEPH